MKEIITLSAEDQYDAVSVFNHYLNEWGSTLLLILGSDIVAESSLHHIRRYMLNHPDFISIEFIHVPDYELIDEVL